MTRWQRFKAVVAGCRSTVLDTAGLASLGVAAFLVGPVVGFAVSGVLLMAFNYWLERSS
ncbi:hypothetical protein ACFZCL_10305 [Streptomyces sp. NPDC008159]|uniref:hypothetical protein n=1 Tax=Streptomyces sp. NPDC008159 TaxID=3364817 RepID=UPI0036E4B295